MEAKLIVTIKTGYRSNPFCCSCKGVSSSLLSLLLCRQLKLYVEESLGTNATILGLNGEAHDVAVAVDERLVNCKPDDVGVLHRQGDWKVVEAYARE